MNHTKKKWMDFKIVMTEIKDGQNKKNLGIDFHDFDILFDELDRESDWIDYVNGWEEWYALKRELAEKEKVGA